MNVPKLRFKDFSGEYKNITFDKLANYKKGPFGSSLKKDMFVPKDANSIKVYEQQNAIKKDWTLERYFITKEYYEKLKGFTVKPGDIIVSCAGTIGEYYVLPYNAEIGVINQALMRISTNNLINQNYFLYIFDNMVFHFSKTFSNGSAIKNIPPFSDLKKQIAYIPSIEEQNKVAQFLSLLDKKIELQTKKIEALKLFKLCISNLCFNDHKNWNYKISDFCYITTSTSKIKYIDSSGKRYIMDMGTINSDGNTIYSRPTNYNKDLLNKGDLIMPKDDIGGGLIIGKTAYIDQNNKYILGDHVFCLKSKNINSLYLHYLINSSYINKSLRKKVTGSAQLGINSKNVLNQDIFIHEKKVQDVIANTLFKIDSKILLNKIKLEKLLSLKKGFMQNMFV